MSLDRKNENARKSTFYSIQMQMKLCKSYTALLNLCKSLKAIVAKYDIPQEIHTYASLGKPVDAISLSLIPDDMPKQHYFPLSTCGDGNCLPRASSILAFGHERFHTEMRVRIVMEAVLNKDRYLNGKYLQADAVKQHKGDLTVIYAQYSKVYEKKTHLTLTPAVVEDIYCQEVMDVRLNMRYMGIWQLFQLRNVLNRSLFCAYPRKGYTPIRPDFHRTVRPWQSSDKETPVSGIMWTVMGNIEYYNPNHFVALVPPDIPQVSPPHITQDSDSDEHGAQSPAHDIPYDDFLRQEMDFDTKPLSPLQDTCEGKMDGEDKKELGDTWKKPTTIVEDVNNNDNEGFADWGPETVEQQQPESPGGNRVEQQESKSQGSGTVDQLIMECETSQGEDIDVCEGGEIFELCSEREGGDRVQLQRYPDTGDFELLFDMECETCDEDDMAASECGHEDDTDGHEGDDEDGYDTDGSNGGNGDECNGTSISGHMSGGEQIIDSSQDFSTQLEPIDDSQVYPSDVSSSDLEDGISLIQHSQVINLSDLSSSDLEEGLVIIRHTSDARDSSDGSSSDLPEGLYSLPVIVQILEKDTEGKTEQSGSERS
jgi:hypothetical protein